MKIFQKGGSRGTYGVKFVLFSKNQETKFLLKKKIFFFDESIMAYLEVPLMKGKKISTHPLAGKWEKRWPSSTWPQNLDFTK